MSTASKAEAEPASPHNKESKMNPEVMKKLGLADGATDEEKKNALAKFTAGHMAKFAGDADAESLEASAKELLEVAEYLEGEEGAAMKKMAAKFSHMAKMGAEPAKFADVEDEKAKKEEEKSMAKMSVLEATNAQLMSRLSSLEAAEKVRTDATKATKEQTFAYLADQAIAGGYPKEQRDALVKFARLDFEGAKAAVSTFLPKTGAPAQLFSMLTQAGSPVGGSTSSRSMPDSIAPMVERTNGAVIFSSDAQIAAKAREIAESKDPVMMSRIDAMCSNKADREDPGYRLLRAQRIAAEMYPEMAAAAEQADLAFTVSR
jgi:hypothetical protein